MLVLVPLPGPLPGLCFARGWCGLRFCSLLLFIVTNPFDRGPPTLVGYPKSLILLWLLGHGHVLILTLPSSTLAPMMPRLRFNLLF